MDDLAWFVGGDADKIRKLQQKLNELGIGERLKEDGVYGKKTLAAWNQFKELLSGSVPQLGFIDPLQPEHTGYLHKVIVPGNLPKGNEYSIILDKNVFAKGTRAFMLDKPHRVDGKQVGYHMNVEFDVPKFAQKFFYNHKEIDESTYLKLKNFANAAKPVRIAGKILLATGIVLDALELGTAIYDDVKDSDNFPEKRNRKYPFRQFRRISFITGSWSTMQIQTRSGRTQTAADSRIRLLAKTAKSPFSLKGFLPQYFLPTCPTFR